MAAKAGNQHLIELKVQDKSAGSFPGLDLALKQLREFREAITAVRAELLETMRPANLRPEWTRTAKEWEKLAPFKKSTMEDLGQKFNIDVSQLKRAALALAEIKGLAKDVVAEYYKLAGPTAGLRPMNPRQAGMLLEQWGKLQAEEQRNAEAHTRRMLGRVLGPTPAVKDVQAAAVAASMKGKVQLVLDPSQIEVLVGGKVQASAPAASSVTAATGGAKTTTGSSVALPGGGTSGPPPVIPGGSAPGARPPSNLRLLRTEVERMLGDPSPVRTTRVFMDELGRTVQEVERVTKKGSVTTTKVATPQEQRRVDAIGRAMSRAKTAARAALDTAKGTQDWTTAATQLETAATQVERLSRAVANHPRLGSRERINQANRLADLATSLRGQAAGQRGRAAGELGAQALTEFKGEFRAAMQAAKTSPGPGRTAAQAQAEVLRNYLAQAQARAQGATGQTARGYAGLATSFEQQIAPSWTAAIEQEATAQQRSLRSQDATAKELERRRTQQDARRERLFQQRRKQALSEQGRTLQREALRGIFEGALAEGFEVVDTGTGAGNWGITGNQAWRNVRVQRTVGKDLQSRIFRQEVGLADYTAAGGDWTQLQDKVSGGRMSSMSTVRRSGGAGDWFSGDRRGLMSGRNFVSNLQTVTAWTASVWTLYTALEKTKQALASLTETGYQTARLEQVFLGVGGDVLDLRNNVMALAAANGRSGNEALEASIQWARLGLTYQQVSEAVRVSLVAANVAELSTAESTKYLQSIMQAYQLQVSELGSVLAQMNAISNRWNVTNAELMTGLSRVANVAKQAGLPLQELMGIIGATVGFTGQSGANIGNAIKSFAVSLANPDIQRMLKQEFAIEVRQGDAGEVKNLSDVIRQLYIQYQGLTRAEQQYLLVRTARKTQASRIAASLDAYVQAQVLAINAQLDLNSATEENAKILGTLRAGWQGVVTELERFIALQGQGGYAGQKVGGWLSQRTGVDLRPEGIMRGGLQAAQNTLSLLNTPAGSTLAAGTTALMTAMGLRAAVGWIGSSNAKAKAVLANPDKFQASELDFGVRTAINLRNLFSGLYEPAGWRPDPSAGRDAQRYHKARLRLGPSPMEALGGVGRQLGAVPAALQKLPQMAVLLGTAMSGVVGSFIQLAPAVLAVVGLFKAYNWAAEKLGFSSETANTGLDELTQSFERNKNAAQAALDAVRLYDTVLKALPSQGQEKRAETARTLRGVMGGMGIDDATAVAIESGAGYEAGVAAARERAQQEYYVRLALSARNQEQAIANREAEAKRLRDVGREREAQAKELEARQLRGEYANTLAEIEEGLGEENFGSAFRARRAYQEAIFPATQQLFESLPAANPLGAAMNRVSGVMAQLDLVNAREADLNAQQRALSENNAANEERIKALMERRKELLSGYKGSRLFIDGMIAAATLGQGDSAYDINGQVDDIDAEMAAIQSADSTPGGELRNLRNALNKRREELTGQLGGALSELSAAQIRSRVDLATGDAQAMANQYGTGSNPTEQLLNRQSGLVREITQQQQLLTEQTDGTAQKQETLVRLMELSRQLYETNVNLSREQYAVTQAQNELEARMRRERRESLMTGGPQDMLRNLAAYRLTHTPTGQARPVAAGEFLSYSPELRRLLGQWQPSLSPEGRDLAERRSALAGVDPARLRSGARNAMLDQANYGQGLADAWVAALSRSMELHGFTAQVNNAAASLAILAERAAAALPAPVAPNAGPPANPNSPEA